MNLSRLQKLECPGCGAPIEPNQGKCKYCGSGWLMTKGPDMSEEMEKSFGDRLVLSSNASGMNSTAGNYTITFYSYPMSSSSACYTTKGYEKNG